MKNFDPDEIVNLRAIQQYLYCPHRWGLIEINCSFSENFFVARGNLVHQKVDEGKFSFSRSALQERSVNVYCDEWGLYGIVDCLEFRKNKTGTYISKYQDKFDVSIVEYKVTSPKDKAYRYEDAMQLLAQKICVDSTFKTDCKTFFYFGDTRKRVEVVFQDKDYNFLRSTLATMRSLKDEMIIPPKNHTQYCSGCSMKDICMSKKGL